jgi:hypothetical protein
VYREVLVSIVRRELGVEIVGRTIVIFALASALLTSCAPTFGADGKPQEEFDRDRAQCTRESTTKTIARYGPSQRADWNAYALCMGSKGYERK